MNFCDNGKFSSYPGSTVPSKPRGVKNEKKSNDNYVALLRKRAPRMQDALGQKKNKKSAGEELFQ
jgi:hypothetical protein